MKSIKNICVGIFLLFALVGCATLDPSTRIGVDVDSIASPDAPTLKNYVLMAGSKDISTTDLQFKEFAAYIDKVLLERGYAKASDISGADLAIFVTYAIGNPQKFEYSYSLPTWGQTGVAASNTYGTISTYGNSATYSGTTTYTPTYGVTGETTTVETGVTYTRFLNLDAYDLAAYKKDGKMQQLWKTSAVSEGTRNDLRLIFPYMLLAAKPYIGTNTAHKVEVSKILGDAEVQILTGVQADTK